MSFKVYRYGRFHFIINYSATFIFLLTIFLPVAVNAEEITDNDIVESPVEELFEDIFITEEETEKKLMDAELYSKENSESVPDFEKYIKNHNRKSENRG